MEPVPNNQEGSLPVDAGNTACAMAFSPSTTSVPVMPVVAQGRQDVIWFKPLETSADPSKDPLVVFWAIDEFYRSPVGPILPGDARSGRLVVGIRSRRRLELLVNEV